MVYRMDYNRHVSQLNDQSLQSINSKMIDYRFRLLQSSHLMELHFPIWPRSQYHWQHGAAIGFGDAVTVARRAHLAHPLRIRQWARISDFRC